MGKIGGSRKKLKESNVKRDRKGNNIPYQRNEDRITDLPSCLKTKILSYLPIEDAVRSSILSKKWKRAWTSVTKLDFDDQRVRYVDRAEDNKEEHFTNFVNRVLLLRDKSSLQRFSLRCMSYKYKRSLINSWINSILPCNIQELDLSLLTELREFLPPDIFNCKTLVVLKIYMGGPLDIPSSVFLPLLKTLVISGPKIRSDVAFSTLISGCPVLENLQLHHCIGVDVRVVNIIAPALINLFIEELPHRNHNFEIVLDAPMLQDLFIECDAEGYVLKNLDHLIKAEIIVEGFFEEEDDEFIEKRFEAVRNLLEGISHVRILVLSYGKMLALHSNGDIELPIFRNLTDLDLITSNCNSELLILSELLDRSPCLDTLEFNMKSLPEPDMDFFSKDDMHVASCLTSHLKEVTILNFQGLEDDMNVAEYFLKNAKVLEKLTLDYQSERPGGDDVGVISEFYKQLVLMHRQLLSMPRGSTICKVEVT